MTKLPLSFELNLGDAPAATRSVAQGQSRAMSFVEALVNVVAGYLLAVLTQMLVFPLFELQADPMEHFTLGLAFVGVSLARSYVLRRVFSRFV